jgi:hypothetical protein
MKIAVSATAPDLGADTVLRGFVQTFWNIESISIVIAKWVAK